MDKKYMVSIEQNNCNSDISPCKQLSNCPLKSKNEDATPVKIFSKFKSTHGYDEITLDSKSEYSCAWCLIRDILQNEIPIDVIYIEDWNNLIRRKVNFIIDSTLVDKITSIISLWKIKNNNSTTMVSGFSIISATDIIHNELENFNITSRKKAFKILKAKSREMKEI